MTEKPRRHPIVQALIIGFFTIAPLWVTWLVFDFLLGLLARAGTPLLLALAHGVRPLSPTLAHWLADTLLQKVVAVLLTLLLLYGIGVLASQVIGRRLLGLLEAVLDRIPLVQKVYGGAKRFLQTLQAPSPGGQRVVLIPFPTPEMKAVGLLTKILHDADTGEELAVVYVPTAPNPTSGYIEIVPMRDVVQTTWTMEQAMTFTVTGGANGPDVVNFRQSARKPAADPGAAG